MKLAKDCIDVGVQTNNLEPMLEFWRDEVGLPYEELLKVGGGTHQHRLGLNGSVFKLNSIKDPLPESGASGYRELLIASTGVSAPVQKTDPDGNLVTLVPTGHDNVTGIGMKMVVSDLAAFQDFYRRVLAIEELAEDTYRFGSTVLFLEQDKSHKPTAEMRGCGYRYLTVQVFKVDEEHAGILARGGREGRAPLTLGSTARISFITDPDNNWIEVSQRASLTGTLE